MKWSVTAEGGFLQHESSIIKNKLGHDDSPDSLSVDGICGTWSAFATGLFATKPVNPGSCDGFFFWYPKYIIVQIIAVATSWSFSFIGTMVLLKVEDSIVGLRVTKEEEETGLDLFQHNK